MGKKSRRRVKPPARATSKRLSVPDAANYDEEPPVFSLWRLQLGQFCLTELDQEHKAAFADAMYRRRSTTWRELKQASRHGVGIEKIPRAQIKAEAPRFITEEHDHFLAFRFKGKAPMVGYRVRNVFYVLWFDAKFELYNHA